MPLPYLLPVVTVLVVLFLGIAAIVCSTSGGVEWLQSRWKRREGTPDKGAGNADGRTANDNPADR